MANIKFFALTLVQVAPILFGFGAYAVNLYKLTDCDFNPNYKCEVIHTAGVLMPPTSVFTVWYTTDKLEGEGDE